jgi:dTMP kinase
MTRGRFITLEGIDGAGKSSHVEFLARRLREHGREIVVTREPGGTPMGERLRELVLQMPMSAAAEAMVMFAARHEHVATVIEPALAAGRWVLCDRFSDATYAYQCGGRGLDRSAVRRLEELAHPSLQPDATFLFDLEPAVAYERQRGRSAAPDKFESEALDFFRRVREAYLERMRLQPSRFHLVDASGSIEAVRERLGRVFDAAFA